MLSKQERYYDLRMDALLIACSGNTNVIMVWTWMLWLSDEVEHGKTTMCGNAIFRALEAPRMCGLSHAGHIRRGRPSMHLLGVYAPLEPISISITLKEITIVIGPKP